MRKAADELSEALKQQSFRKEPKFYRWVSKFYNNMLLNHYLTLEFFIIFLCNASVIS
jgi:hypothetical protein